MAHLKFLCLLVVGADSYTNYSSQPPEIMQKSDLFFWVKGTPTPYIKPTIFGALASAVPQKVCDEKTLGVSNVDTVSRASSSPEGSSDRKCMHTNPTQ